MRPSDLDPERWQRIDGILDRVLDAGADDRDRVLADACAGDPGLKADVEAFLEATERGEDRFEDPAKVLAALIRTSGVVTDEGRRVGPFRIVREIGRGGMGVVYLAQDTRLGRYVALKALPPYLGTGEDAKRRFEREARAASALDHPNIATLHEIGETSEGQLYMVFAFYEGETLDRRIARGPLPVPEALEICIGIGEGLSEAHRNGIIHRDVKPSNVLLTGSGGVKLLDFGVAKVAGEELTGDGIRLGTVAYMSPEHGESGAVDGRADLWSLGVVLYEMLTGSRPFTGPDPASVLRSVLHDEPVPVTRLRPDVIRAVERVVARLLRKDPAHRYRDADELIGDLRAVRAGELSEIGQEEREPGQAPSTRRLAVLPLRDGTGAEAQAHFVGGIHEALVAGLGQVRALEVLSRASTLRFRETDLSVMEIIDALDVDAVVAGSVDRREDGIVVTTKLVAAGPERELWSGTYRGRPDEVLDQVGEAVKAIGAALGVRMSASEERRIAAPRAVRPAAYEAFTLGQFHLDRRSPEGYAMARKYLERAIELDPEFAPAYAVLAETLGSAVFFGLTSPADGLPRVRSLVERALALDSDLAVAHTAQAAVRLYGDWDWTGAEAALREAIRLNPSFAYAYFLLAEALSVQGRYEEALAAAEGSTALERYVPFSAFGPVIVLKYMREFERAVERSRSGVAFFDDFWQGHWLLGQALLGLGRVGEALAACEAAVERSGRSPLALGTLGLAHALAGRPAAAMRVAEELDRRGASEYVGASNLAMIHGGLGYLDRAFDCLEDAYRQRDMALVHLADDVSFDALRPDPRYRALVRKMGLPEAV